MPPTVPVQAIPTAKEASREFGLASGCMLTSQQLELRMRMLLQRLHGMPLPNSTLETIPAPDVATMLETTMKQLAGIDRVLNAIEAMIRQDLPMGNA